MYSEKVMDHLTTQETLERLRIQAVSVPLAMQNAATS